MCVGWYVCTVKVTETETLAFEINILRVTGLQSLQDLLCRKITSFFREIINNGIDSVILFEYQSDDTINQNNVNSSNFSLLTELCFFFNFEKNQ